MHGAERVRAALCEQEGDLGLLVVGAQIDAAVHPHVQVSAVFVEAIESRDVADEHVLVELAPAHQGQGHAGVDLGAELLVGEGFGAHELDRPYLDPRTLDHP